MRTLSLPPTLKDSVFVVSYERLTDEYMLMARSGNSYNLGEYPEAVSYINIALRGSEMNEFRRTEILDRANAFVAVQVDPSLDLIIQCELPSSANAENELIFNRLAQYAV